jgi:hypothetical protein
VNKPIRDKTPKNHLSLCGLIGLAVCFGFLAGAQAAPDERKKPIEIHFTTVEGLRYTLGDDLLARDKDFEELVFPLGDFEATRLLKKSESSQLTGQILKGIGLAGLVTGLAGLLSTSSGQQTPFWLTAAGGGILFDIGGFFQSEAQTSKFNCVQRYNRFARGEEQVLPKAPQDEKSLLNFNSGDAPPNHSVGAKKGLAK